MNTTNCQKPIVENDAYYSRVMSSDVIARIKNEFAWILEYVERHPELDYQTGSNASDSWFSIYRGTGRLFTIKKDKQVILDDFSLDIPSGAMLALVGPDRQARSMILDAASGHVVPDPRNLA